MRFDRTLLAGAAVGVSVVTLAATAFLATGADAQPREIRLVARGMSFHLEGEPEANPVLRLRAGEVVTVLLRNETPGVVHDFAVPALGIVMSPVSAEKVGRVSLRAPDAPGQHEYICRPHALMMRGVLDVTH